MIGGAPNVEAISRAKHWAIVVGFNQNNLPKSCWVHPQENLEPFWTVQCFNLEGSIVTLVRSKFPWESFSYAKRHALIWRKEFLWANSGCCGCWGQIGDLWKGGRLVEHLQMQHGHGCKRGVAMGKTTQRLESREEFLFKYTCTIPKIKSSLNHWW